jgi:hypothetical protein
LLHYPRRLNPALVNSSGDHDGGSEAQAAQSHVRDTQIGHGNNNSNNNNLQNMPKSETIQHIAGACRAPAQPITPIGTIKQSTLSIKN